jgi:ATP-dependent Clp protease adaptor protein ClpS
VTVSVAAPVAEPDLVVAPTTERTEDPSRATDLPYDVFLWNDPVTLMDVVVRVLSKVFGYDGPTAEALMLRAHREGKAVVWSGNRDEATRYCIRLGRYGLQSTVAKA